MNCLIYFYSSFYIFKKENGTFINKLIVLLKENGTFINKLIVLLFLRDTQLFNYNLKKVGLFYKKSLETRL
jgi:hypothetical protein